MDLDHLAKKVVKTAKPLHNELQQTGKRLKQIVVGGPRCMTSKIDQYTASTVKVTNHQRSFKRYLDDTDESGDGYEIPSVRNGRPMIEDIIASAGKRTVNSSNSFDPNDSADRANITSDIIRKLDPRRYHRARQKAQCKRLEHLLNDWFDKIPTAAHAIILRDKRNSHQHLINQTTGESSWVKYPTECDGTVRDIKLRGSKQGCLSWALAAIFDPRHRTHISYSQLTAEQQKHVQQWLSEAGRRDLGYPLKPQISEAHNSQNANAKPQNATAAG
jgi:hypothetical protein